MSLAQTFSQSIRTWSSPEPSLELKALAGLPDRGRPAPPSRLRVALRRVAAAGLELVFFGGVGGMMAAGALLFR